MRFFFSILSIIALILGCMKADENLSLEFQLTQNEKYVYESLKRNLDESELQNLDPKSVAKLYVSSRFDDEHERISKYQMKTGERKNKF